MKRIAVLFTVLTVSLLWILTIVSAGARPVQESDLTVVQLKARIGEEQPDVYVEKWRESIEPTPGGTYLYNIHYGNNGAVPAGLTTIVDTLPKDTEVVEWYSRSDYDIWQGSVSDGKLTLEAPAIPAQWSDDIILRLRVAQEVGLYAQLVNKVTIATTGDSDPENNEDIHYETLTREPVRDLRFQKESRWGTLVPGGVVKYRVEINNDGNMPVNAKLVDTLPDGTTYLSTDDYEDPVLENGTIYWDMGELLPGERQDIHFSLSITDTIPANTLLKNCAEAVMVAATDENPNNDMECVVDLIHKPGPNLRVEKHSEWEETHRIRYEIMVANTGSTGLSDIVVTDSYPDETIFSGDWHADWDEVTMEHKAGKKEIKWTVPDMDPEDQLRIEFWVELKNQLVGEQGLTFVNLVEAPVSGDIYPEDNSVEHNTYSGANLYVEKWVTVGDPKPGEQAIFTISFGNDTKSYWDVEDVVIRDTLPDGLKFIKATTHGMPDDIWEPSSKSGNAIVWEWGYLWPDAHLLRDIYVKVEDDRELGELLTNKVIIRSDNENNVDPDLENNKDTADLKVWHLRAFMPVIMRP